MSKLSWGDWFEDARLKTRVLAEKALVIGQAATKIAQESADEINKQARGIREKYELDTAASAILTTLGGPKDTSTRTNFTRNTRESLLDVVYVTENLISMPFPYDHRKNGKKMGAEGNDINIVSKFLKQRHGSHFMIWNISEESYDYSYFENQVLEHNFPGHPAPPLGILFKICTSIENWLDADEKNVAVVHCLTGKGRTAALMSCILTWIGEFASPIDALQYVAERRGVPVDYLTIPSQRRYVQYFTSMLGGLKPSLAPLLLRRVIMTTIPNYSKNSNVVGCCPYIQLFQCGSLIATSTPSSSSSSSSSSSERDQESRTRGQGLQLSWLDSSEGSVSFTLDCPVQGDLLIRCRHADACGARVSMLRAAFHTGYITSGILRLKKSDLDGACSDTRFDEDFFIDLIFAPLNSTYSSDTSKGSEAVLQTKGLGEGEGEVKGLSGLEIIAQIEKKDDDMEETLGNDGVAVGEEKKGTEAISPLHCEHPESHRAKPTDSGLTMSSALATEYKERAEAESMFWDAVALRQKRCKKRASRKFESKPKGQFSITDDYSLSLSRSNDSESKQDALQLHKSACLDRTKTAASCSTEDLIKQISCLEAAAEKTGGGGGGRGRGEGGVYEGNNNDSYEKEATDYDEDYEVSFDKTYPVEQDFVQDSLMTPKALNGLESNMMSPGKEMRIKVASKKEDKDKDKDDFQRYLNTMSTVSTGQMKSTATASSTSIRAQEPSSQSSASKRSAAILESSIFGENPLHRSPKPVKAGTSTVTTPIEKKADDEEQELDELEQYLLKLNTS